MAVRAQVIFFPSHNAYRDPAVTRRVLDYFDFMNSKARCLKTFTCWCQSVDDICCPTVDRGLRGHARVVLVYLCSH